MLPEDHDPPEADSAGRRVPAPLRAAAGLVLVEGLLVLLFGLAEATRTSGDRLAMGASSAVFFVAYGVALGFCSWGMHSARSWARGPVLLSQLMLLGLAWGVRHDSLAMAISAAVVALIVLAGVLHPASIDALERDRHDRHERDDHHADGSDEPHPWDR
ncbi:hypothetical protein [Nocardioides terrisoli]|uniref:hypothetical protein n=1 Tax=Nocardioides terrisoli TaxID=3388267 RepID=UPI00287B883E|nr:hypothetical protein [Nocardioides marmorisolisilvae]